MEVLLPVLVVAWISILQAEFQPQGRAGLWCCAADDASSGVAIVIAPLFIRVRPPCARA
jgi:hypothetical protein